VGLSSGIAGSEWLRQTIDGGNSYSNNTSHLILKITILIWQRINQSVLRRVAAACSLKWRQSTGNNGKEAAIAVASRAQCQRQQYHGNSRSCCAVRNWQGQEKYKIIWTTTINRWRRQTCGTSTEMQCNGGTIVSRQIMKYSLMSTIKRRQTATSNNSSGIRCTAAGSTAAAVR